jgi:uncharacterized protein (DUF488 family)
MIYTIGHSTNPINGFIRTLQAYAIVMLVDVRSIPKSRHNPQFNEEELKDSLGKANIDYIRIEELGGRRHTTKSSVNTAWKKSSFRGFADYMQTQEFKRGIDRLILLAADQQTVIMCAEVLPWRCHRSLIGDALLVRNITVMDIIGMQTSKPHQLTPWAKVSGVEVTYPEEIKGNDSPRPAPG